MENNQQNDGVSLFYGIVTIVIIAVVVFFAMSVERKENKENKEYGEKNYEFRIVDKYETLGSSYHIIGGRATETEYHIVYEMRCTNRPDDKFLSNWQEFDDEVNYRKYRKYEKGKVYRSKDIFLP